MEKSETKFEDAFELESDVDETEDSSEGQSDSEEQLDGMLVSDLKELISLGEGLYNGIDSFKELGPLLDYFKEAGNAAMQGEIITWEQLAELIGQDWVEILKEGGKSALGIKAVENAMKGIQAYQEHPDLFEAVIDTANAAKDSINQTTDKAYQELLNANEDGRVTMGELSDIALKYSYYLVADIANSSGGQYLIDELLKAAGIDPNNIVQDALFLVLRKVMSDITDPVGKEGASTATQEFILSTLPLILGSDVWNDWTGYLVEMAPVLDMYFTFGLSVTGAMAQAVEEGAMQALSALSDVKYKAKNAYKDVINWFAGLFGRDPVYEDKDYERTYNEEMWANLLHANVSVQIIDGHAWTIFSLGSYALAITSDPFNETGTAIRWNYYTTVSWEVRNSLVKAATSLNEVIAKFKTIIKASTVIPGKAKSLDALQQSLYLGENKIKGALVDAINAWAPVIGEKAAAMVVSKLLRWLIMLAMKGVRRLEDKIKNAFRRPEIDPGNLDKPSINGAQLNSSSPTTPDLDGDLMRRRRSQMISKLYPTSVEPWITELQEGVADE